MKKYLFIAAISALSLGACSKNEVALDTNSENAVSFTTYAGRALTKANGTLINGANFSTSTNPHIGVFAWLNASGKFLGTETPNMMDNVDVTLQSGGTVASATYSNLQYWPKDAEGDPTYKNVISFAAYYPYGDAHITSVPAKGLGAYTFKADDDASLQTDFMVSSVKPNMTKSSSDNGAVPFVFHHMLTKVQFFIKQAADYPNTTIKIDSIALAGVKTTGTLTSSYNNTNGNTGFEWSAQATPRTYELISSSRTLTTDAVKVDANSDFYTYLMIPQILTNDVTITFKYTVTLSGGATVTEIVPLKLNTAKVGTTPIDEWERNQNIKYTFTVGLDVITFKASAEAWAPEEEAGLTVTK